MFMNTNVKEFGKEQQMHKGGRLLGSEQGILTGPQLGCI
jgi:hypothetical protein